MRLLIKHRIRSVFVCFHRPKQNQIYFIDFFFAKWWLVRLQKKKKQKNGLFFTTYINTQVSHGSVYP